MGIQTDGEIFEWDNNQLPAIKVGNQKDWLTITTYGYGPDYHASAIKVDGTLWAWGNNSSGELGDGTFVAKTNPTKIGNATDWRSVSNGNRFTLAIKSDGTLWAWGNNDHGQLGDGTIIKKNVPTRIGTDADWQFISTGGLSAMGIKSDGTLWAWGDNTYGKLGDGTTTGRRIPTKIGTSLWKTVSAGDTHTLAVKKDGTLWSWGYGASGALGTGQFSLSNSSTPRQVGSAFNWMSVVAGGAHSLALTTDGILWVWGSNGNGELGIGKLASSRSVPSPLPAKQFSCGQTITLADLPVQGTNIKWYTESADQFGVNVPNTYVLTSGQHFYATQTINGLESCRRLDVVGDAGFPLMPLGSQRQAFCPGATIENLSPSGPAINWYETAGGGSPLQGSTPLIDGKEYYASQTFGGCESADRLVVVAVVNEPGPPTGESTQTFCLGATVENLIATGSTINWYETASSVLPLQSSASLINGTEYYASQSFGECESAERLIVVAAINDAGPPTGESTQTFCLGATVENLIATGSTINWYETASSVLPLQSSASLINGTEYYASQSFGECESDERLIVAAVVNDPAPPIVEPSQTFCSGATVEDLVPSGTNINWYEGESGGSPLLPTTSLVSGSQYYATRVIEGCESGNRPGVVVGVTDTPLPTGEPLQTFDSGKTIADLIAEGSDIKWYGSQEDASNGTNSLSASEQLITGASYFATQTISGCESSSALAVQISIVTGIESADKGLELFPNPVYDFLNITYYQTIDNVTVINSMGQLILFKKVGERQTSLDLSKLDKGIYLVQIQVNERFVFQKIVKQ